MRLLARSALILGLAFCSAPLLPLVVATPAAAQVAGNGGRGGGDGGGGGGGDIGGGPNEVPALFFQNQIPSCTSANCQVEQPAPPVLRGDAVCDGRARTVRDRLGRRFVVCDLR